MPTKSAKRTTKSYRVLPWEGRKEFKGFDYPKSRAIRDRLRGGDDIPREQQGELIRHALGSLITNPPDDLIEGWLARGRVELVTAAKSKKVEGVQDDA